MEIKNIISEHLDEKLISNIIVDEYINENLQKKYENVINQFNLEKDDIFMLTNFLIKPQSIKIYENNTVYFQEEEEIFNNSFIFGGVSNYEYDEETDDEDSDYGWHRCVVDGSDCGFCNNCRYDF